ncbi:MAG: hypothetical protein M3Q49_20015 [Actinomycetota bacterium]|nr:hypothetical protein [Actinomycetota bacterium]
MTKIKGKATRAKRMLEALEDADIERGRNPLGRRDLRESDWVEDGGDERYELDVDGRLFRRGEASYSYLVGTLSAPALARLSAPLRCEECGVVFAGKGALASHAGSFRCDVDATARRLEDGGYARCANLNRPLAEAGVEVVYDYSGWRAQHGKRDEFQMAYWAPAWAVDYARTLGEMGFSRAARRELISDAARLKNPKRRSAMVLSLLARDEDTRGAVTAMPSRAKSRLASRLAGHAKVPAEVAREVAEAAHAAFVA